MKAVQRIENSNASRKLGMILTRTMRCHSEVPFTTPIMWTEMQFPCDTIRARIRSIIVTRLRCPKMDPHQTLAPMCMRYGSCAGNPSEAFPVVQERGCTPLTSLGLVSASRVSSLWVSNHLDLAITMPVVSCSAYITRAFATFWLFLHVKRSVANSSACLQVRIIPLLYSLS